MNWNHCRVKTEREIPPTIKILIFQFPFKVAGEQAKSLRAVLLQTDIILDSRGLAV